MSRFMLSYIDRPSPVHSLSGATKLIVFLLWSVLAMAGYDTRIMCVMTVLAIIIFAVSGIKISEMSFILKLLLFFMVLNLVTIYLFAPEQGVSIYGTRHVIAEGKGRFTLTWEQLFYELNVFLKYTTVLPLAMLLIATIQPSEFAASLNRIGVPYTIAYAVSLTFRYIPDVQRDFENISQAQQARGIELSKKQSLLKRFKGTAAILLPLIFSSIDRIDVVSRAMELRSFGKHKKRTWYNYRPFSRGDITVLIIAVLLFALGIWITFKDGSRFWNPFV
ncbi:energy-coupling factor transporter transmembrane component T family protein [Leadbettera azotonutricia]|uniref:Cobalt transport protein superfamily n=1 Tax=Leadbettera azotonutricia (strain ATCC BAA-888 / DSM 13862 / ZAS-9) TaxID=545695 RepID=F5YA99_LEAAZ|nr:energy-coupling factor transporter transmembrane component T [Leadbettera azotonutricia]AEF82034.1 cobalt transport protein superfamily [Leadbettera azotonutricia ZAS-9]